MMTRLCDVLERVVAWALGGLFLALILVVGLQVMARNVLQVPMIWTLDVAQLLFSWCIFLGAALAWRKGAHYEVNLWPATGPAAGIPRAAGLLSTLAVVYILAFHGWEMAQFASRRTSQSLGITEFWYFLPIPLCGAMIGLFLAETLLGRKGAAA